MRKEENLLKRTGVNCSLYLSKEAAALLSSMKKKARRSKSVVVSLLLEKFGPLVMEDPKSLIK